VRAGHVVGGPRPDAWQLEQPRFRLCVGQRSQLALETRSIRLRGERRSTRAVNAKFGEGTGRRTTRTLLMNYAGVPGS
jgi:hypothetical protein